MIFLIPLFCITTILIVIAVLPYILRKINLNSFVKNNPNHVKMRIFMSDSCSALAYKIRIFSVNDKQPVLNSIGDTLYLIPGKNKILAQFVPFDIKKENERSLAIGLTTGLLTGTFFFSRKGANTNNLKVENAITIDIDIKRNWNYEMKANTEKDEFRIIGLCGEKHEIKAFK